MFLQLCQQVFHDSMEMHVFYKLPLNSDNKPPPNPPPPSKISPLPPSENPPPQKKNNVIHVNCKPMSGYVRFSSLRKIELLLIIKPLLYSLFVFYVITVCMLRDWSCSCDGYTLVLCVKVTAYCSVIRSCGSSHTRTSEEIWRRSQETCGRGKSKTKVNLLLLIL